MHLLNRSGPSFLFLCEYFFAHTGFCLYIERGILGPWESLSLTPSLVPPASTSDLKNRLPCSPPRSCPPCLMSMNFGPPSMDFTLTPSNSGGASMPLQTNPGGDLQPLPLYNVNVSGTNQWTQGSGPTYAHAYPMGLGGYQGGDQVSIQFTIASSRLIKSLFLRFLSNLKRPPAPQTLDMHNFSQRPSLYNSRF